jgi:microcystin-dependent protein
MSEPFLSEIKIMSFGFPPKGWALCNGQSMPINQNQALFSLLGTTYGGDGRSTFNLPNLQGRAANHMGAGFTLGQVGGEQNHTLSIPELASHIHSAKGYDAPANDTSPASNSWAQGVETNQPTPNVYNSTANTTMISSALANTGGSQAHANMQPYLVLSFCIALQGIFPSQN